MKPYTIRNVSIEVGGESVGLTDLHIERVYESQRRSTQPVTVTVPVREWSAWPDELIECADGHCSALPWFAYHCRLNGGMMQLPTAMDIAYRRMIGDWPVCDSVLTDGCEVTG